LLCDAVFRAPNGFRIDRSISTTVAAQRLQRTNVLTLQDDVLDFAAPFLRSLFVTERYGSTIRPTTAPETLEEFLIATFTVMNPVALQGSLATGSDGRLLERAWQMEFYRAATQVLPRDIFISPDVGSCFGVDGFLDFYVDDGRKWAIELLRDGEGVSSHLDRFGMGGLYDAIVAVSNAWVVIDIRNPDLRPPRTRRPNCVYVRCHREWREVNIEFDGGRTEVVKLMGGS
jgi:hypothetical protein